MSKPDMLSAVVYDDDDIIHAEGGPWGSSYGIGNQSFHFGMIEMMPKKSTVPVPQPGEEEEKKLSNKKKSKAYQDWEKERQKAQDPGPRRTLVQTHAVDNYDNLSPYDSRVRWFV
jgi:hypothetical protein